MPVAAEVKRPRVRALLRDARYGVQKHSAWISNQKSSALDALHAGTFAMQHGKVKTSWFSNEDKYYKPLAQDLSDRKSEATLD